MVNKKEEIDSLANALICIGAMSSSDRARSMEELKAPLLRGLYRIAGVGEYSPSPYYREDDEFVCALCDTRFSSEFVGKIAMLDHMKTHDRCSE